MSVNITGPILSALLFEHCNADGDREGLLLGKVTTVITNKISDSDISVVEHQTVYNVYSFLPFPGLSVWRDSKGALNKDVLAKMLDGYDVKEVLGWYKLRRNSSLSVSLRERAISRHISDWLGQIDDRQTMIFMLCVSRTADVYTCDHQFMAHNGRGSFVGLPETVISVADVAQPDYKQAASHVSSANCTYNKLLSKSRSSFIDDHGECSLVAEISRVTSRLHSKLHSICESVLDSEMQIAKELAELKALQRKVDAYRLVAERDDVKNEPTEQFSRTLPSNLRLARKQLLEQPVKAKGKAEASGSSSDVDLFLADEVAITNCSQSVTDSDGMVDACSMDGPTSILDVDDCSDVQVPCLIPKANSSSPTVGADGGSVITGTSRKTGPVDMESGSVLIEDTAYGSIQHAEVAESVTPPTEAASVIANGNELKNVSAKPFEFVSEIIKSATLPRTGTGNAGLKKDVQSMLPPMERSHSQHVAGGSHKPDIGAPATAGTAPKDKEGYQYF
jgi:hypothetical protein